VEIIRPVAGISPHLVGIGFPIVRPVALTATADYSYTVYLPSVLKAFCSPTGPANITLRLNAQDDVSGVASMLISNVASFNCAVWEPNATTKEWHVPQGATTTVYVKFRDNAGNISEVVTDTITMPLQ